MNLVLFLIFALGNVWAAEEVKLKFEDIPSILKEKNQEVRAAKTLAQAAEAETGHLGRSYLPQLTLSAGGETFKTGTNDSMAQPYGTAEAKVNLFRGGRDLLEERARRENVNQSIAEFEQGFQNTLSTVRELYWELLYRKELAKNLSEAMAQNEKNGQSAIRRIRAGMATETDKVEFELNALRLKQELARVVLEMGNVQHLMSAHLNFNEGTRISVSDELPHSHEKSPNISLESLSAHRDVKLANSQKGFWEAKSSQAYRWWAPSVDLYGSYSLYTFRDRDYLQQSDRYEPVLGIRLTVNVFDGLESRTAGAADALRSEAMASKVAQIERVLKAKTQTTYQELEVTHDLIHSSEEIMEKAKRYLERTLSEYAKGIKNSLDVLSATNRYYENRAKVMEMKRDYLLARVHLMNLMGQ